MGRLLGFRDMGSRREGIGGAKSTKEVSDGGAPKIKELPIEHTPRNI